MVLRRRRGRASRPQVDGASRVEEILRRDGSRRADEILRRHSGPPRGVGTAADLPSPHRVSNRRDHENEVDLRWVVGVAAIVLMVLQVLIANGVFVAYAWAGRDWDLPSEVIGGWLAACVVEVIGVAKIVTSSLFEPGRDRDYHDDRP